MKIKTKAAVLFELNKPLKIIDLDLPYPQMGEVLVKVNSSGICHTQLLEIRGKNATGSHVPNLMGHEGSGVVLKIGKGVKKVKVGDHVVLSWIKGKGRNVCPLPIKYKNIYINRGPVTSFARHTVVSENRVFPIMKKMPLKVSALLGCAVPTGMGMIFNNAKLKKNSSILVIGCGGIGINAIHAAKIAGAKEIIAADIDSRKKSYAKFFGATNFIDTKKNNITKFINKISQGKGLDYAIDTTGKKEIMEIAYNCVNKFNGQTILCGVPNPLSLKINIDPFPLYYGRQLKGTGGGETIPDKDINNYVKMYINKKLFLNEMISHRFSLEEINQGIKLMNKSKCLRVIIDMEKK